MKITAQEEYGMRLLLRIAIHPHKEGITISQLSKQEGLSPHYVAKICRYLRLAGFIRSTRGKEGGYLLALPPEQISLNEVLMTLGGRLFTPEFCNSHTGLLKNCSNSCLCEIKPIWQMVQQAVDEVLNQYTLKDLMNPTAKNNQQITNATKISNKKLVPRVVTD